MRRIRLVESLGRQDEDPVREIVERPAHDVRQQESRK